MSQKLTHLDNQGNAAMVDVSAKAVTSRVAQAGARVSMQPQTLELIAQGSHKKGDVLSIARIAGIQAAKRCSELIPLCHPLMLSSVKVELELDHAESAVNIVATCKVADRTGVEMEALTAVSTAALTIYDMVKAAEKTMEICDIRLVRKEGGKSGTFEAPRP